MGNGHPQKNTDENKPKPIEASAHSDTPNLKKYIKLGVIGRGGFGKVIRFKLRSGRYRIKKTRSYTR